MPTKYRFVTDGDFVNFYDDDSLVLRLHNSSRHVQWNFKDDTGVYFNIDELRYQIELSTISFNGAGISEKPQFATNMIALFPNLAASEGGGTTPGIDDVLGENQPLAANRIINVNGKTLTYEVEGGNIIFRSNTNLVDVDFSDINSSITVKMFDPAIGLAIAPHSVVLQSDGRLGLGDDEGAVNGTRAVFNVPAQTITLNAINGTILEALAGGGTTGLSIDDNGKIIRTP